MYETRGEKSLVRIETNPEIDEVIFIEGSRRTRRDCSEANGLLEIDETRKGVRFPGISRSVSGRITTLTSRT